MDIPSILILSLAAAVLGLDSTAFFQSMVSRPLVAGAVGGWLMGDWQQGLTLGAVLELIWLAELPVGSLVPPDACSGALFASGAHPALMRAGSDWAAAAALALLGAVAVAALGARAESLQRRLAGGLDRWVEGELAAGRPGALGAGMLGGLGLVAARCALVMALALLLLLPALERAATGLSPSLAEGLGTCFWLLLMFGLATAAHLFWERRSLAAAMGAVLLSVAAAYVLQAPSWALLAGLSAYGAAAGVLRWRGESAPEPAP